MFHRKEIDKLSKKASELEASLEEYDIELAPIQQEYTNIKKSFDSSEANEAIGILRNKTLSNYEELLNSIDQSRKNVSNELYGVKQQLGKLEQKQRHINKFLVVAKEVTEFMAVNDRDNMHLVKDEVNKIFMETPGFDHPFESPWEQNEHEVAANLPLTGVFSKPGVNCESTGCKVAFPSPPVVNDKKESSVLEPKEASSPERLVPLEELLALDKKFLRAIAIVDDDLTVNASPQVVAETLHRYAITQAGLTQLRNDPSILQLVAAMGI